MSKKRDDLDRQEWKATWTSLGPGIWIMCCWSPRVPMPVGMIYFNFSGKGEPAGKSVAEIYHSEVMPFARRLGVRTFLNQKLFDHFGVNVVTSRSGTKHGSAWMKARGYRVSDDTGDWFVSKADFEASLGTKAG